MASADFARVKQSFFDRQKVLDPAERAARQVLSRFGAFVRRRSQSSIRTRKTVSSPGSPPSSHVGTLRRSILFAYDPSRGSVVIGPVPFRGSGSGAKALEEGGKQAVARLRKGRPLTYRARPFMRPAFAAELAGVAEQFRGVIGG